MVEVMEESKNGIFSHSRALIRCSMSGAKEEKIGKLPNHLPSMAA
jgi:hypothetical protein